MARHPVKPKPAEPVTCPKELSPQFKMLPDDSSAELCDSPATMARTFEADVGTLRCPKSFRPQPSTVPFSNKARLWPAPEAMATERIALVGTTAWPSPL